MPEPETTSPRPRGRPGYDRDTVLRRAIELFNKQGYDGTSMADLAADLGISKSAVFHHFPTKQGLLAAALDEALDGLSAAVDAAADATSGGSARDRLLATLDAAVRILAEHLPAVTLLLRVRGNSDLELAALERRRHIDERLATLVRRAAAEGDLRPDLDPELISRLVFGMVNSLVDWYRPSRVPVDAIATSMTRILFEGLRA